MLPSLYAPCVTGAFRARIDAVTRDKEGDRDFRLSKKVSNLVRVNCRMDGCIVWKVSGKVAMGKVAMIKVAMIKVE